jgi:hypothetical protein
MLVISLKAVLRMILQYSPLSPFVHLRPLRLYPVARITCVQCSLSHFYHNQRFSEHSGRTTRGKLVKYSGWRGVAARGNCRRGRGSIQETSFTGFIVIHWQKLLVFYSASHSLAESNQFSCESITNEPARLYESYKAGCESCYRNSQTWSWDT